MGGSTSHPEGFDGRTGSPLVSVVLPTFNRADCIGRAIRSVLAQTYTHLELIVVDDGSSDRTVDVVRGFDDPRLRLIVQEQNGGAGAARNAGLAAARGELIAFQDSDDEWLLDKLRFQVDQLQVAGRDYSATYGGKLQYGRNRSGRLGRQHVLYAPDPSRFVNSGDISLSILDGNLISPQTLLFEKRLIEKVGIFDTRMKCDEDWEFMIRLAQSTKVLFTFAPVVVAFLSEDSISLNRPENTRYRTIARMVILKKSSPYFARKETARSASLFVVGRGLQKLGRHGKANVAFMRALPHGWRNPRLWAALFLNGAQRLWSSVPHAIRGPRHRGSGRNSDVAESGLTGPQL